MNKLSIFLADDHAMLREGLKRLIDSEADMEVVGEAGTGSEAVERIEALQPGVAVVDISMPELGGLEVVRRTRAQLPRIKILVLTVHEDRGYSRELLEAGASGYVLKRATAGELIEAIRQVASGKVYVDPRISDALISSLFERHAEFVPGETALSERERMVLRMIAQGYSNREIGVRLGLSVKTIETYKARSMEKLRLQGRVDIVRYAQKAGWLNET